MECLAATLGVARWRLDGRERGALTDDGDDAFWLIGTAGSPIGIDYRTAPALTPDDSFRRNGSDPVGRGRGQPVIATGTDGSTADCLAPSAYMLSVIRLRALIRIVSLYPATSDGGRFNRHRRPRSVTVGSNQRGDMK